LREHPGASLTLARVDLSDLASVRALAAQDLELDVLVNNAGIVNGSTIQAFDLGHWQRIVDINLTGTFLGMRAAADALIAAGGGSIVNVSSIEGLRGSAWAHGYVATKWAVRGLTKSVAIELAPHGVRVNSIHPGLIRTPMTEGIPDDIFTIPLGRAGTAEEVARLVLFLASDESSYSTGAEFVIDGGAVQAVPH
jgi:3alpha(or 20beta)-hydroxysteroid dehydrogenase